MNQKAKGQLIVGLVMFVVASGIFYAIRYNHDPTIVQILFLLLAFPIPISFIFVALIRRNYNEYDFIHGINDEKKRSGI